MKSLPTFLLAAVTTLAIGTFVGCGNTTYEIYPNLSPVGPVVTVPSAEDDGNTAESLSKIEELEAKIDELNQKIIENQTEETPKTPEQTPDPKSTPILDPKPDDQAPLPTPEEEPKTVDVVKESRAEAEPPQKEFSVTDSFAYSPLTVTPKKDGDPLCGDGLWHPTEDCDDGNQQPGDGCFDCRSEPGWECDGGSDMTPCWRIVDRP